MRKSPNRRRWVGVFLFLALAACGSDGGSTTGSAGDATVAATEAPSTEVPQRIVSLSPTHTEMLFALGAAEQVVAVDSLSNYPPEAAAVLTNLSAFEPNVEAIAEYEPDLVIIADDSMGIMAQLEAIDIPVWIGLPPASIDDVYAQIVELAAAIGRSDRAEEVVGLMRSAVETILAQAPMLDEPLSYYHELDDTYYSVTSNTFVGSLYELFGLRNIADASEGTSDYPQLSAEFIVSQDPDLVFLADTKCCGVTPETVAARPGWESLGAVVNGNVIAMDDDLASRWGPRIVDYLYAIGEAIAGAVG
ncbi:MAG: ABC transporter substrate-binding protein [Acidimicrobiales bacterium mtb01]|nr:ABC transporter substrate-binding protein [Actinomycetota bacterium]TEX47861.1 MAG: ABC transporter substrate-binding protein [Acidimicrobiales bacterium mtb01]